jgi:hypothetical protein
MKKHTVRKRHITRRRRSRRQNTRRRRGGDLMGVGNKLKNIFKNKPSVSPITYEKFTFDASDDYKNVSFTLDNNDNMNMLAQINENVNVSQIVLQIQHLYDEIEKQYIIEYKTKIGIDTLNSKFQSLIKIIEKVIGLLINNNVDDAIQLYQSIFGVYCNNDGICNTNIKNIFEDQNIYNKINKYFMEQNNDIIKNKDMFSM